MAAYASFIYLPTTGVAPLEVTFDGAYASYSDSGTIVSYDWDFGDGNVGTGGSVVHTFSLPGNYDVRLTVTDSLGATDLTISTVIVTAPNQAPVASFTVNTLFGTPPLEISFDNLSSDSDGTIVGYVWDFGDGDTSTDQSPLPHTYTSVGEYTVTLTVTDNEGATGTESLNISVGDPVTGPEYTISITEQGCSPDQYFQIFFNDGTPSYSGYGVYWDFDDGNTEYVGSQTNYIGHVYSAPGTYTIHARSEYHEPDPPFTSYYRDAYYELVVEACNPPQCTAGVSFTIGTAGKPWSYTLDWGDGDTYTESGTGVSDQVVGHLYTQGSYTVEMTLTVDGETTTCSVPVVADCEALL